MRIIYLVLSYLLSFPAYSSLILTENGLRDLSKRATPTLDEIEATYLSSDLRNREELQKLSPELYGSARYAETNEKPIIPFIPIFSPVKAGEVGIRQNLNHGISVSAGAATTQQSAVTMTGKYRNVTTTSLVASTQIDLWRDLMGRATKAKLRNAEDERKRAEFEKAIQEKAFHISLRKIYWALVANNESLKISKGLLQAAETQAEDSRRRFKNNVAETDEVARNNAQVASRRSTLISLEYQKKSYIRQLRTLIPDLADEEISLGDYDIDGTISKVLACTTGIAGYTKVPYENTLYDDSISLLRGMMKNNKIINEREADPEVALVGRVQSVGVSSEEKSFGYRGSYGDSIDDMTGQNRTGYSVGINVVIPLGDAREATQKTRELYDEKRMAALVGRSESNLVTVHQEIMTTIGLLNEVIEAQRANTVELNRRLTFMRKKYQQARASINDLIQDQDALLSSELLVIDTRLAVLNVVLDYLAVYSETPCEFNRI